MKFFTKLALFCVILITALSQSGLKGFAATLDSGNQAQILTLAKSIYPALAAANIKLYSPDSGGAYFQRDFIPIRWDNSNEISEVSIELYLEGAPVLVVAANTPADGVFDWFVPLGIPPGSGYRIRISSLSESLTFDESDEDFSILSASQPALTGVMLLDGIDDYAAAPAQSELDLAGGSFTVEAWVNFQDLFWRGVFLKAEAYGLHVEKSFSYPNWYDCLGIDYPSAVVCCTSQKYLSFGWHHVALVYDQPGAQVKAYFDGIQRCQLTGQAKNSDQPLWVGRTSSGFTLDGALDEMRISSLERYGGAFEPPGNPFTCDSHTLALWHFDEPAGEIHFNDTCGENNILDGINGSHTSGFVQRDIYLPVLERSNAK